MIPAMPARPCSACDGSGERGAIIDLRSAVAPPGELVADASSPAGVCPVCGGAGVVAVDPQCALCGRRIDRATESAYSCGAREDWHCADCHFGGHGRC